MIPPNCPSKDLKFMKRLWRNLDITCPHFLWYAKCGHNFKNTKRLCATAFQKRWLDMNGPQILAWSNTAKDWRPYQDEKDPEGFARIAQAAYESYLTKISRKYEEDKMKLIQAIVERGERNTETTKAVKGSVVMLSNQLPVWFNCTDYGLRPGGTAGFSQQIHPAAFVVQDFFPFINLQRQYSGSAWQLNWRIPKPVQGKEKDTTNMFQWRNKKSEQWRTVRILNVEDEMEHSSAGALRKCSLMWRTNVDENNKKKKASKIIQIGDWVDEEEQEEEQEEEEEEEEEDNNDNQSYEIDANGNENENENSLVNKLNQNKAHLYFELDCGKAYDWFRFDFLEFANQVTARIRLFFNQHTQNERVVVYDPVAGSCWFPMLIQAALRHEKYNVQAICSDISSDAMDMARNDYQRNNITEGKDVQFLVGDLYDPLKQTKLRPNVVYFLPPQELRPEDWNDGKGKDEMMNVPKVSVFLPDGVTDRYYFFHRMCQELPSLLADNAIVFISVAHEQVDDVLKLIETYSEWPKPNVLLKRDIENENENEDENQEGNKRLFFNPSGLIEYQFL